MFISFRPNDVAIIRVKAPFNDNEFDNLEIYRVRVAGQCAHTLSLQYTQP